MGYTHGLRWTPEHAATLLASIGASAGRMPSAPELYAQGRGDLANYIRRQGGFRYWAGYVGLPMKDSETCRGQTIEAESAVFLVQHGFTVERMTTRAPFDLLVNGHVRVDVKSGKYGEYGKSKYMKGFVFALSKRNPTCDLYMLCGVTASNVVLWRYFIPAHEAKVVTITITPEGKYSGYRNNISVLERMALVCR